MRTPRRVKPIERVKREEMFDEFDRNSNRIISEARAEMMHLTDYLQKYTIQNKDDELSQVDYMLWQYGFECFDAGYTPSSALNELGDWSNEDTFDRSPPARLFFEKMGDRYAKTMYRGLTAVQLEIQRGTLNTLAEVKPGTAMNLYDDTDFYRAKQFGPIIDYRDIIGMSESTVADAIRKNKYDNKAGERMMKITPEGTDPPIMQLDYSQELVSFMAYGLALEATYDFLMSSQTRAQAIMNAVDEIAIAYRTMIFEQVVKAIKDACPAGNRIPGTSLTMDGWLDFRKKFTHYSLDVVLGDNDSITEWEKVVFGLDTKDITLAYLALFWQGMVPMAKTPMLLNRQPSIPDYGWYPDLASTLVPNELLTFERMRSSKVYFRRNLDQDETVRDPKEAKMTRYFRNQLAADVPDPNGIYTLSIGA